VTKHNWKHTHSHDTAGLDNGFAQQQVPVCRDANEVTEKKITTAEL
jgi:hypothetical protein